MSSNAAKEQDINFENENFADLFEKSFKEEKEEGTVVTGTILSVSKEDVIIDIGLKSEGRIPLREFTVGGKVPALEAGQAVEVYLEKIENYNGQTVLSREKAVREEAWEKLEEACTEGSTVDGVIFGRVKGGFTVDIGGVVAFLPGSQVDIRPIKDIAPLMNIEQPFQILKMDRKQGNIVVSRRAIMEESRAESRNEMLSQISEGQVLEGVVKNITDYGAFIDLGSVDGLVHVTDISWSRISHPSEKLTLGQTVEVKVIKFDDNNSRISLGIKQLTENPWEGIEERFPVGSKFKGQITNITDYGAFVELEKGIEGLVHVSEFSWTKNNQHPRKLVEAGQEVEVMVLDIDSDKHRISLGMKQCEVNPWQEFADANTVGNVIEGTIKNVVDFGLFVGFENGVDGLVHVSDLSWDDNPEKDLANYEKDKTISVKLLSIDVEKERISLGIKQMTENPNKDSIKDIKKGDVVTCTVTGVKADGIDVTINDTVKASIKKSDLARERVEQRPDKFAIGDKVDAKVLSTTSGKVSLSVKALEIEEEKKAIAEYGSADSGASLGDILGAALNKTSDKEKGGDSTDK